MTTAPPDIVREVVIAAPPEVVFPYFTDPETMIVWKAVAATRDARPAGIFQIGHRRALPCHPARPPSR